MKNSSTEFALFSLRVSIFLLMIVWAVYKVITPGSYGGSDGNPGIFENFYGASVGHNIVVALGVAQIILLVAFVLGLFKTITYGAVTLMNTVTLLVSLPLIMNAFSGPPAILFTASIPVFGASVALFLMRHQDRFLSVGKSSGDIV